MENMTDYMYFGIMNDSNVTNGTEFNCLSGNISSSTVTNQSFWMITLSDGAPAVATVFAIYFLLAFSWNLFIILTFLNKRKMLREAANILLLNLAIADLTVAMTQMIFSMVTEASEQFVFGRSDVVRCGMCNFVGVFFMLLYGVSMHTLAALSFDRFLLLYKPFRYKKIMTPRNTIVLVLIIWLIAAFLAIPPVVGFGQIEFNGRFGSCVPRFSGENEQTNLRNFYYVAYVALESLFPIITIAVCSFWTYRFVNKFLRRNYRRRSFYNRRTSDGVVQQRQEDTRYHNQQHQLVKVFGALLVSNVVSWFPVLIVVVVIGILGSADSVPDEVYVIGWICFLTAPVFHPIIESFFVKDMRLVVCRGIDKGKRAGSFIARSTTGMFGNKDIESANEKADDQEYVSQRKIRFFGNRRNRTVSVTTEVTEIPTSSYHTSSTPSPEIVKKLQEANKEVATPLDIVQLREKEANADSPKTPRRITFSDESPSAQNRGSTAETPVESPLARNGARKSALKSPLATYGKQLAPVEEGGDADSASSADESVFIKSPDSPQHKGALVGAVKDGEPDKPVTVTGFRNGVPPVAAEMDSNEEETSNSNGESSSDLKLLETVYSERRGSLTLV